MDEIKTYWNFTAKEVLILVDGLPYPVIAPEAKHGIISEVFVHALDFVDNVAWKSLEVFNSLN